MEGEELKKETTSKHEYSIKYIFAEIKIKVD